MSGPAGPGGAAPTGFGVLGCGSIGPLHARALRETPGARLVAVADRDTGRAGRLAGEMGVTAVDSLEKLLAVPGVDVVCVCTPSGTHAELGSQVAAAGRHVVLEKPIDVTVGKADAVIDACRAAGVSLGVISQHRFDPGLVALKAALEAGELGAPIAADARAWWYRTQAYYDADAWRGTWLMDGGALSNQGVHLLDVLLWLMGPAEGVFARAATATHDIEVEDTILLSIRFGSGAIGSLAVTTSAYPGYPESVMVMGSEGSVVVEAGAVRAWQTRRPAQAAVAAGAGGAPTAATGSRALAVDAHRAQLEEFVTSLAAGCPPAVTGEDGRAAVAVIQAAYESARTGAEVAPVPAGEPEPSRR